MIRKNYILKPKLQLKYLLLSLLMVILTAVCVYYAFWSSMVRSPGLEQLSAGEWRSLQHAYHASFVWVVLILITAIGLESLILFHRMVGPLFVLENSASEVGKGILNSKIKLRRTDELKDFADIMKTMITNIRTAVQDDRKKIALIEESLNKGEVKQAKDNLNGLTSWFKTDPEDL